MKSLSFGSMAELYDETRVFDRGCFDSVLDYLVERFPPKIFSKVLEPGIGTGRIAIPLAQRGYRVTGADISEDMLALLKRRLAQSTRPLQVYFQKADVTKLPFPDAAFDMAIIVHLFYFIREWKRAADEILRVVRTDGPVVLMHTGMGTEVPFLNDRYKDLCAEYGCSIKTIGVKSTREVVDYFMGIGCHSEQIRDRWQWTSHIHLHKALGYIQHRAYSFTTVAPENVHSMAIERLECKLQQRFGSLTTMVEVPNQIYLVLIMRDDQVV
jgi:ubiquinone/menaquinone biosynthesis C-methylase UbiE